MSKEFLDVDTIRNNAIFLAEQIYTDKFIPSVIYVGLRGGTTLGNVISEYFKLVEPVDAPPLYAGVVAHSYSGVASRQDVYIDGWTYNPSFLRHSDKVLLVDDIFDSGHTINKIAKILLDHGILRKNLRIVVHDYKERTFNEETHKFVPDYYSRKFVINTPEEDNWIHYLSHELDGLSQAEVESQYDAAVQGSISKALTIRAKNIKKAHEEEH